MSDFIQVVALIAVYGVVSGLVERFVVRKTNKERDKTIRMAVHTFDIRESERRAWEAFIVAIYSGKEEDIKKEVARSNPVNEGELFSDILERHGFKDNKEFK